MPVAGEICSQLPPEMVETLALQVIGWLVLITETTRCSGVADPATARNVTPDCETDKPLDWTGTLRVVLVRLLIEMERGALPLPNCGGNTNVSPNTPGKPKIGSFARML